MYIQTKLKRLIKMTNLKNKQSGKDWVKGTWNPHTDTQYSVDINYVAKKSNWVCDLKLDGKITRALGPSYDEAFINAKYRVLTT